MQKLKIEYIKTNKLKEYANNAKIHTAEQIEQIKQSIQEFGMNDPIAVWKDNEIIEGHGRLLACKELEIEEVPIIRLDALTDEQRKAYMNVHNQLTMNTGFDFEKLAKELAEITNIDMEKFGFNIEEYYTNEAEDIQEDDYIAPVIEEPKSKAGQIYKLGNHILMIGDSTKAEDVEKLTEGIEIDLTVTDPPYNVDLGITDIEEAKKRRRRLDGATIKNDAMSDEEFYEFLLKAFKNAEAVSKPGAAFYIWHPDSKGKIFRETLEEAGIPIRQNLIWVKNSLILGRQDYQWIHEPCLYGWKPGAGHYFVNDRTQTTVEDDGIEIEKMKKEDLVQLVKELIEERKTTVIHENKPSRSEQHPTMKPIRLIAQQIANSSRKGEAVLDLFGGSGTTLLAAEQLGRNCYMMEYDPKYADVIIDRWEKYTGRKAELIK